MSDQDYVNAALEALSISRDLLCALRHYVPQEDLPLVNAVIVNDAYVLDFNGVRVNHEFSSRTEEQARDSLEKIASIFYGGDNVSPF